ncbi:4'-phosphopantetheinyl transferase family protein [Actinoplanes sp. KI2]|uniref:4'-phosphopantetheinyl transferase family protein n=1 Tax=Actinoplanes sp. KI2 TaxID=2983315 RepID=UPI0039834825
MLSSLLPSCVVAREVFADPPDETVFPGEEDLVARAVSSRRREFVTGRRCARLALAELGHPPAPIRPGPGREPIWPAGVTGSITHCAGYRAAAVARTADLAGLGIDAEPNEPLPDGVEATVASPREGERLREAAAGAPEVSWDRLLFSAKESIYKAWYPLTRRWLGFEEADLTIEPGAGTFNALLRADGTRIDGGPPLTRISGRFTIGPGLIITAVTVDR